MVVFLPRGNIIRIMIQNFYDFTSPFQKFELDDLIKKYDKDLPALKTLGEQEMKGYRIGDGTWISSDKKEPVVERFRHMVAGITGLPYENQETPHFVRYGIGGKYDAHQDYFHPGTSYYEDHIKRGGQRVFSVILYLNDGFKGGETEFPNLKFSVTPVAGKIFAWRNMTPDGQLFVDSRHAGLPVTEGVKYILISWVRQNKFT